LRCLETDYCLVPYQEVVVLRSQCLRSQCLVSRARAISEHRGACAAYKRRSRDGHVPGERRAQTRL